MFGDDAHEAEPEEPDPEADLPDPESELPDVPKPPETVPESEVPRPLLRSFWKLVAVFNLALFALSLGPMLVFFRDQWVYGGLVFGIGVVSFVYGYWGYRTVTAREDWESEE